MHFQKKWRKINQRIPKKNIKIYIDDKLRTWINEKITFPPGPYAEEYNTTQRDKYVNSPF